MSRKASRDKSRNRSRNKSRMKRLRPLAGLLAAGLTLPGLAAAQSEPYPTYVTGPQPNGSWVVSSGQVITPAGTQVDLGIRVRAKAIALNPNRPHSHRRRPHLGRDAGRRGVRHQHRRCPAELHRVRTGFERQL